MDDVMAHQSTIGSMRVSRARVLLIVAALFWFVGNAGVAHAVPNQTLSVASVLDHYVGNQSHGHQHNHDRSGGDHDASSHTHDTCNPAVACMMPQLPLPQTWAPASGTPILRVGLTRLERPPRSIL